jgi:cation:H+ antiporter
LALIAIPGLIHPSKVADEVIVRDYPVMLLLTLLLFILSYKFHKKHSISRFEGIVFNNQNDEY